jgi:type IV fimbrial biogenesis protein FimT
MSRRGAWTNERGFTLVEVLITVVIMGIVLAIATSSWFKVVESRRVDSATNQVVADLRLAHTQAKNRLIDTSFIVPSADSSTYQIGPPADLKTMTLPGDDQGTPKTKILVAVATTITFHSNGSAEIDPPGDITITVAATDGDPSHMIRINSVTSRVKVVN